MGLECAAHLRGRGPAFADGSCPARRTLLFDQEFVLEVPVVQSGLHPLGPPPAAGPGLSGVFRMTVFGGGSGFGCLGLHARQVSQGEAHFTGRRGRKSVFALTIMMIWRSFSL